MNKRGRQETPLSCSYRAIKRILGVLCLEPNVSGEINYYIFIFLSAAHQLETIIADALRDCTKALCCLAEQAAAC